jgi:hypothetical protein
VLEKRVETLRFVRNSAKLASDTRRQLGAAGANALGVRMNLYMLEVQRWNEKHK